MGKWVKVTMQDTNLKIKTNKIPLGNNTYVKKGSLLYYMKKLTNIITLFKTYEKFALIKTSQKFPFVC